jgi:hypothetical protein
MLEAFRQSIIEIEFLVSFLKETYDRIILFGVSLGGHLVALGSQLIDGINMVSALASPFLFRLASKAKIVPIANTYVAQQKQQGLISSYKILYPTNLKYFEPYSTNEKTVIIGGMYDRIVPFQYVNDLANMLNKPLYSYPGGHLTLIIWFRSLIKKINKVFNQNW